MIAPAADGGKQIAPPGLRLLGRHRLPNERVGAYDERPPMNTLFTKPVAAVASALCIVLAASAQTAPPTAPAATAPDAAAVAACRSLPLRNFERIPGGAPAFVNSAAPVSPAEGAPYCEVSVNVSQQVGVEMRLPLTGWNGRFWMNGGHGLGGEFAINETSAPLARGYAVAAGDMGHHNRRTEAGWAYKNTIGKIDFAYRATHVATLAAKAIVVSFYGRPIAHAYYGGFSTGGRQGLMEAERYPLDFEGIIAGPAPIWASEMHATSTLWTEIANHDKAGHPILLDDKLPLLHDAVTKACDGGDGLHDGLIVDPRTCHWNPATLQCPNNVPAENCLTRAQIAVVRAFYATPHDSAGHSVFPGGGLMRGSEVTWQARLPYPGSSISHSGEMGVSFARYLAFVPDAGPLYNSMAFNFDRDPQRMAANERMYDATNPDLHRFRAHGGKLIMFSGWADEAMPPLGTVKFYDEIVTAMGGPAATQKFVRLFMIPGQFHDPEGVGPIIPVAGFIPAMEAWVEGGVAPDRVVATEIHNGVVTRSRPVFPYPLIAHYSGTGDPNSADSFTAMHPH
jgi:feruloyl esterase